LRCERKGIGVESRGERVIMGIKEGILFIDKSKKWRLWYLTM